jgi:hypothetical protein
MRYPAYVGQIETFVIHPFSVLLSLSRRVTSASTIA